MEPTKIVIRKGELRNTLLNAGNARQEAHDLLMGIYDGMVASSTRKGDQLFPPGWSGRDVAADLGRVLDLSENFTIAPDMYRMVVNAAKSMPPEVLLPYDLPSSHGYLILPEPLSMIDIRGVDLRIKTIVWAERSLGGRPGDRLPESRGIVIWLFTDMFDPADDLYRELIKRGEHKHLALSPADSLIHCMSVGFGKLSWSRHPASLIGTRLDALADIHDGVVLEDESNPDLGQWTVLTSSGHRVVVEPDPIVRFLQAFFSIIKTEIVAREDGYVNRAGQRTLRNMGLPPGAVTVIAFRRYKKGQHSDDGMWTLTERHVRRGHWRRQWCGPKDERFQRYIWIAPTIVGPDDAPLRVRDTVNVLAR